MKRKVSLKCFIKWDKIKPQNENLKVRSYLYSITCNIFNQLKNVQKKSKISTIYTLQAYYKVNSYYQTKTEIPLGEETTNSSLFKANNMRNKDSYKSRIFLRLLI